jgi:hypothetical protein
LLIARRRRTAESKCSPWPDPRRQQEMTLFNVQLSLVIFDAFGAHLKKRLPKRHH